MIKGAETIPSTATQAVAKLTSVKTEFKKAVISAFTAMRFSADSYFSKYPLKVGIKATVTLFSANSRLNKLGSIKAVVNASASGPVPKKEDIVLWRIKPKIREARTKRESFEPLLTSLRLRFGLVSCVIGVF